MNRTSIFLFLLFFKITFSANGQFFKNSIIKTRPLQDFIGYNPNIGLEKPLNKKYSIELDLMYRNRTWYNEGGEWNFGSFKSSNGIRILTGFRNYFSKKKDAPLGWFWGTQFVVKYSDLKEVDMLDFSGEVMFTQNIRIFQAEIIPVFGYQFHFCKRISSEVKIGLSFWPYRSEKTEIIDSENIDLIGKREQIINDFGVFMAPEFTWSIGFLLSKVE